VFRSRLRSEAAGLGYDEWADHLERRARSMAGFVDFKTFMAADTTTIGSRIMVGEVLRQQDMHGR
jgi:hypothetical protein